MGDVSFGFWDGYRPKRWLAWIVVFGGIVCLVAHPLRRADASEDTALAARDAFVSGYRCMVVEHLLAIHERGNRSKDDNRYFIVAMSHNPQRFVQCIFHEIDTILYCEASSGRYGPAIGKPHSYSVSDEAEETLTRLGYKSPYVVANFGQEIALGDPPDFRSVADLLLTTLYDVYKARPWTPMVLTAPLLGLGKTKLDPCYTSD